MANLSISVLTITSAYTNAVTLLEKLVVTNGGSQANGIIDGADLEISGGTFSWTGGTMFDAGVKSTTIDGGATLNISGTADKTLQGRVLDVLRNGTVNWNGGGRIILQDDGVILTRPQSTFNITASSTLDDNGPTGAGNTVNITGTLNVTGGVLTSINAQFLSSASATIAINSGDLLLDYGSTVRGVVKIATGSELRLGGLFEHTLDDTQVGTTDAGSGFLDLLPQCHLTLVNNVLVKNLVDDSRAAIDGAGNLNIRGTYDWNGSQWAGTGRTSIDTTGILNILSGPGQILVSGRTLVNGHIVTWTANSDLVLSNGASIVNARGGLFDIRVDHSILDGGGAGAFTNEANAVLQKSAGSGNTYISIPFTLPHAGTVKVLSGWIIPTYFFKHIGNLILGGGGGGNPGGKFGAQNGFEQDGGSTMVGEGSTLMVTGDLTQTGGDISDLGTIAVSGDFSQSGGTVEVSDISAGNGGVVAVSGSFQETGGLIQIFDDGRLTSAAFVQSAGSTVVDGTIDPAVLMVTGSFLETGGSIQLFDNCYVMVGDTLEESGGTFSVNSDLGAEIVATNSVQIDSGVVFSAIGGLTVTTNGMLNYGTLSIGDYGCPSNLFVQGSYTQADGATLTISADGPEPNYSELGVRYVANLAGTLNINLTGGYVPMIGDYFPSIVGWFGSRSGAFASIQPTLSRWAAPRNLVQRI